MYNCKWESLYRSWIIRSGIMTDIPIVLAYLESLTRRRIVIDYSTNSKWIYITKTTSSFINFLGFFFMILLRKIVSESVLSECNAIIPWELRCVTVPDTYSWLLPSGPIVCVSIGIWIDYIETFLRCAITRVIFV